MSPELFSEQNQPEYTIENVRGIIKGIFIGKIDEIEFEIEQVNTWKHGIRLGHKIRRRETELESLNKLRREMIKTGNKVMENLGVTRGLDIKTDTSGSAS